MPVASTDFFNWGRWKQSSVELHLHRTRVWENTTKAIFLTFHLGPLYPSIKLHIPYSAEGKRNTSYMWGWHVKPLGCTESGACLSNEHELKSNEKEFKKILHNWKPHPPPRLNNVLCSSNTQSFMNLHTNTSFCVRVCVWIYLNVFAYFNIILWWWKKSSNREWL